MRILILSSTVLSVDNSFGNSFNNIFKGLNDVEIANIFCEGNTYINDLNVISYYKIEKENFIKNLINENIPTGYIVKNNENDINHTNWNKTIKFTKKIRLQIFFWMRNVLWKIGRWNSTNLRNFIIDYSPDILFFPIYYSPIMNDILYYIYSIIKVPLIGYISDDNYTLKQFNLSPLYWIDRLWYRKKVKRSIMCCKILYVISEIQKREYEKIFNIPCKILTKMYDFNDKAPKWSFNKKKLTFIYAGNIGSGRWRTLEILARVIERLNKENMICTLNIYTMTPLTWWMKHAFAHKGVIIHPPVDYKIIQQKQEETDIQVHVEGLSLSSRLTVHQSFSTKLVDFFKLGKPILAIGTKDVASISHLIENDAAIIASDEESVYNQIKRIWGHPEILEEYGLKAYECGQKHHNKKDMQFMLVNDIRIILSNKTL